MWSIRILSGQQAGQIYDLKLGKNIFGRGGSSDFKVQSLGISKEHCEIHMYKDKMMIVDLKSSNGTFVNGVKIQNSAVRVGDKISLFDVIMDVIPTPDLRPHPVASSAEADREEQRQQSPVTPKKKKKRRPLAPVPYQAPQGNYPVPGAGYGYPTQGSSALQMGYSAPASPLYQVPPMAHANVAQPPPEAAITPQTFSEKIDHFMETKVMPVIYRLVNIFSFKQVLQGFILLLMVSVTLLSAVPLSNIIQESNLNEAYKRARSVARAMAKFNEQALLSGQLGNLSVTEAMKEDGIKEALIVQQADGLVVAPPEKAGRDEASSIVLAARKESRAIYQKIDNNTIGATFPIAVYDPNSGEAMPKYHAIVKYDVSALNFGEDRLVSLFMQTLVIASLFGLMMYMLFARLIEYPIRSLNEQIDRALMEKSDRTEVEFDYPAFQKLIANVNTILNRAWTGEASSSQQQAQPNHDVELTNLIGMISQPAFVLDASQNILAVNQNFEQLLQISADGFIGQSYQTFTDSSLVQNIESLVVKAQQSPFEKHSDRIPFSQFECEIHCQVFLDGTGQPSHYVLTLVQVT